MPNCSADAVSTEWHRYMEDIWKCRRLNRDWETPAFYPRDMRHIRKHSLCYGNMAGWLAGWVSVTRQYYIKMAKSILKLLQPSGSPIIVVFCDPFTDSQFQG